MYVRAPDIRPQEGPLMWSKTPEFCMAYNAYSVVIPYVEYYLNNIMNQVRKKHCADNPELAEALTTFVQQETNHARYHVRFNQLMFDAGIEGLKELVDALVADLKQFADKRSLAFNTGYCAGFESIATYDARYLFEQCDEYFEGAGQGANLLLWHVAEEFEHRAVCHDAFHAVSGRYFLRIYALFFAFWHVGGAFVRAEELVLKHYTKNLPEQEQRQVLRRSQSLFWRQIRYVAPRMLKILSPWYNPARLRVPRRIQTALDKFRTADPITARIEFA